MDLSKLKTEFLEYLEIEKNRSLLTIRNYDLYLTRFLAFAKKHDVTDPRKITLNLVRNFRLHLNRLEGIGAITQNYHVIAIRSFLKYLAKRDVKTLTAEKLELPKTARREVEFLESGDLEKLLRAPAAEKNDLIRLRDTSILELLFSTGLRVHELATLKIGQVNLKKDEFSVRGKGGKLRIVFLSPRAKAALTEYLQARADNAPSLFIQHNRRKIVDEVERAALTERSIQRIVKKYALLAGVSSHITPHTLRHTMATDLLQAGADLRSVQEILGHSSITTTQIYTHITNKRLKETYQKYHGKAIST